jgi:hypothetical protein
MCVDEMADVQSTNTVMVTAGKKKWAIDLKYIEYSTYLYAAYDYAIHEGRRPPYNIVIENTDPYVVGNYLQFLMGKSFHMSKRDAAFFSLMGHHNTLSYPLDYWKVKLRSKWIRDNFNRLELWRDPFYGLVEVPVVVKIPVLGVDGDSNVYVAGGAALFMAGITTEFDDIDLFTTNKMEALKFMEEMKDENAYRVSDQAISQYLSLLIGRRRETKRVSLIKRLYRSPSEIVHGFDLDASQFLVTMVNGVYKAYGTEIGLYAIRNMENWVDPEMASTTYLQRLAKYQAKGFSVRLPLISPNNINLSRFPGYIGSTLPGDAVVKSTLNGLLSTSDARERYSYIRTKKIPHDTGSILFYIAFFGLRSVKVVQSLLVADIDPDLISDYYAGEGGSIDIIRSYDERLGKMETQPMIYDKLIHQRWIEVNPSSQKSLSGIIYPVQMGDLVDVYKQSPLYRGKELSDIESETEFYE